jgi:hypothetical protein
MTTFKGLATFALAAAIPTVLPAEHRCPGNVASLPFQVVNDHQIVLPVTINHSGPYDFLLDTGTETTILDSAMAAELHLTTRGSVAVGSYWIHEAASYSQLNEFEVGSHAVANLQVVVYDLKRLRSSVRIRGILGEDFLQHFDMLIDNARKQLCLDDSAAMRVNVQGTHIPFVAPEQAHEGDAMPRSLIVATHFANGLRVVRLQLDSGANASILYKPADFLALGGTQMKAVSGAGVNGDWILFQALPPENLRIGSQVLHGVSFYAIAGTRKDTGNRDFDGVLSIGLFRRVFINHTDRFVILEQ